ncbi:vomeronasal type-2 receptor 26-like [Spea bombifrons]|uniref:vomeronasal type-2 receptor 26-like n=1 Tax=Spea bombifrons TaxID=233779 RepID=UPI00234B467C|nr:vomeronasal type-2 receptor 26-like [Spea bombifrons]
MLFTALWRSTVSIAAVKSVVPLCVILLCFSRIVFQSPAPACSLQLVQAYEDYDYFQDGDIIIGAVFTHVNLDPNILPNITLGYHLYDSCLYAGKAVKSIIQILSGPKKTIPNYSCMDSNRVAGFIGDQHAITTVPIAQVLGVYGYAQISYGASDYEVDNRRVHSHFFQTWKNNHIHLKVICQLLKYFGWTWVGILTSDDDSGEKETQELIFHYIKKVKYFLESGGSFFNETLKEFGFRFNIVNWPPRSQCSENCLPGYRKVLRPGTQTCCYDCVQCSEGEISNISDSEKCIKCPDIEWSNETKEKCIPKVVEFLSYTNDAISIVLSCSSVLLCVLTLVILIIFTVYRDTPVVKANNKNLSFLLLVSLMLSFLCVFLFLGRPEDVTCMLRQTAFGVLFSLAVSSVLGKTIMIYIVFKATKPGSPWANWVSTKVSNSIVLLCSSIQLIINICWLAISPPFQELDKHSYQGKIIVQCNEGSVIAFYCVLGYMGLLAAVSFIMAFLARTLPDSFNEAKYITFSMLLFCSVWIAMIPAYLSTKGKYMVAVEIFAILASNAGLLMCIFLPKCYIILLRPNMNTKLYLLGSRNKNHHLIT